MLGDAERRPLETEHLLLLLRRFPRAGVSEDGCERAWLLPRQGVLLWVNHCNNTYKISTIGRVSFGQARNWIEEER